jgi:hypothetical protein
MKNLKEREYQLVDGAPLSFVLKTGGKGNLLIHDPKKGNRPIRHCRNEKSIFIEEQSEHALLDPIIFRTGLLKVPATEMVTQKFLDTHPDNVANGGYVFEEIDDEKNAAESLEREDLVLDLKQAVREKMKKDAGIYELQAAVSVLKSSTALASKMTGSELRRELYQAIEANPYKFLDEKGNASLFDEKTKRNHLALVALATGEIITSADGRSLLWADTKAVISHIPAGRKPTEHLQEYLTTDEGILVLEEISKRV